MNRQGPSRNTGFLHLASLPNSLQLNYPPTSTLSPPTKAVLGSHVRMSLKLSLRCSGSWLVEPRAKVPKANPRAATVVKGRVQKLGRINPAGLEVGPTNRKGKGATAAARGREMSSRVEMATRSKSPTSKMLSAGLRVRFTSETAEDTPHVETPSYALFPTSDSIFYGHHTSALYTAQDANRFSPGATPSNCVTSLLNISDKYLVPKEISKFPESRRIKYGSS